VRVRRRSGAISVTLSADEATVVRILARETTEMLAAEHAADAPADAGSPAPDPLETLVGLSGDEPARPTDPALLRLLPDAYGEDPAAAGEFRRLMEGDLRRSKVAALDRLVADLPADGRATLSLTTDAAETWVTALNDIRLVLGVRLDVHEEMDDVWETLTADDPRIPLFYAYERLTQLQHELIDVLEG
jgi:hypothetical protein